MHTPGLFSAQKPPARLKSPSFTTDEMNLENGAVTKEVEPAGGEHQNRNDDAQKPETQDTSSTANGIFIIDWDGPDDTANPMNWTFGKKWLNMGLVSAITLLTPLASSMFAPGVLQLMEEFHSTNTKLASFIVSVYVLGFAAGPMFIAPLSELYGRRIVYFVCNVLFLILTIICGESINIGMLVAFRFLAGCAGAAPLSIGGGSITDMMVVEQRGVAMAIFAVGPLLGPIIGPVAGGYLSQRAGWRWVFRVLAIASGIVTIAGFIFLKETYAPTLLEAKAKHLRKESGNEEYRSKFASNLSPKDTFRNAITRPLRMLCTSAITFFLALYMAVIYGYLYVLFTTFTIIFEEEYHFSAGSAGLTFIGLGVGSMIGLFFLGATSDKILMHLTKKNKGVMKPEYRLPPMVFCCSFVPISLFWYGWSVEKHAPWIVPIIGTSFMGIGMMTTVMPVQTYLIDAFTKYAASVTAAGTILRSLLSAVLPLAGQPLYDKLGIGWGNSLLGFLALAMAPIPWIFWKYGERIRTRKPINFE